MMRLDTRPRRAAALALLGCVMAWGCTRSSARTGQASAESADASGEPTTTPGIPFQMRFEILEVGVSGRNMRPGDSIRVDVRLRALLPTKQARLAILLPEYELENYMADATARGDTAAMRASAIRVKSAGEWTLSLDSGEVVSRHAVVRVAREGYYRLLVEARGDEHEVRRDGPFIQNIAQHERWLWIHSRGGKVTATFDTTVFGPGELPGVGKLQRRPR